MTTKPKARKFRLRRATGGAPAQGDDADLSALQDHEDGFGDQSFVNDGTNAEAIAKTIEAIKAEGLTGRQLRMARRIAQKRGLTPKSDYDAVRLLRDEGLDPFARDSVIDLVSSPDATTNTLLPQTTTNELSTEVITEDKRANEIHRIQRDIVRRRRRRAMFLVLRLLFFVMLPSAIAGYYYFYLATPMYSTKSEFVIQKADGAEAKLGGLFSGTSLANSQDSITVQGYLQSREAMLRLDGDLGFKTHFSQPDIDILQRIETDASNEAAYKLFRKYVRIGFDPTEGVIKMEVIAADPQTSEQYSLKLIEYAEQQVDRLTARLRDDQMAGAETGRREANEKMAAAQERVIALQEKLGIFSPESEVQGIMAQIGSLESELLSERLTLASLLENTQPSRPKVNASRNKITELEKLIAEKRAQLTESTDTSGSLARITGEVMVAQSELVTRQELLAQAETQFEAARVEAGRQVRYLSLGVTPIGPDEATYPRAFENTLLAMLIFSGIYLMVSLTASILREQV